MVSGRWEANRRRITLTLNSRPAGVNPTTAHALGFGIGEAKGELSAMPRFVRIEREFYLSEGLGVESDSCAAVQRVTGGSCMFNKA